MNNNDINKIYSRLYRQGLNVTRAKIREVYSQVVQGEIATNEELETIASKLSSQLTVQSDKSVGESQEILLSKKSEEPIKSNSMISGMLQKRKNTSITQAKQETLQEISEVNKNLDVLVQKFNEGKENLRQEDYNQAINLLQKIDEANRQQDLNVLRDIATQLGNMMKSQQNDFNGGLVSIFDDAVGFMDEMLQHRKKNPLGF